MSIDGERLSDYKNIVQREILSELKDLYKKILIARIYSIITFHWKRARADTKIIQSLKSFIKQKESEEKKT
jgi:hypothetical protein